MNQGKKSMNLIYWDMDGTLIDTGVAGRLATEAIFKRHGKDAVPEIIISESGKTDTYICWQFYIALHNRVPSLKELDAFCFEYETEIVKQMAKLNASLLDNVQNILEELQKKENWMCLLISGNRRNGVINKLKLLGIDKYFNIENSVFGDNYFTKRAMARDALKQSEKRWGESSRRIVVGDAPMDIICGNIMGAETISVATGIYNVQTLSKCRPTRVYEALPSAKQFFNDLHII